MKETILYTIARFTPSVANFLTLSVFSYLLIPEELGTYNVVFAGVMLSNSLLFQWLRVTLARYIHKYDESRKKDFTNTILYFGRIILVSTLAVISIILYYNPGEIYVYLLGFIWLIIYSIYDINLELQRASLKAVNYAKSELIRSIIFIVISIGLTYYYRSYSAIVISYILSQLVPLVIYRDKYLLVSGSVFNKEDSLSILKYGIPLALMLSSSFINNVIDKLLIAEFLGNKEAGLYSVGYDLYRQAIWVPFLIINLTNFPVLVKLYEDKNKETLLKKLKENGNTLLIVATIICSILFISSQEIANLFIGKPYRNSAIMIMPYILVSTILYGISIFHYNNSFQFKGRTDKLAYIYVTGSVLKIGINIFFLQKYGIIVAAYSTVITYAIILIFSVYFGKKEYHIPHPNYSYMLYILLISGLLYWVFINIHIKNTYLSLLLKLILCSVFYSAFLIKANIIRIAIPNGKLKYSELIKKINV
ncbi:lipopolysaccharide biosynthesis protein [Larkinella sp. GY13]|uniref:lipopolysaccharide biosynthesis protein n=1 Tax=Larkinella sp. GY13 TaxID=3453720 RepID=UPI003EEDB617